MESLQKAEWDGLSLINSGSLETCNGCFCLGCPEMETETFIKGREESEMHHMKVGAG